jgi:hypothetical protein
MPKFQGVAAMLIAATTALYGQAVSVPYVDNFEAPGWPGAEWSLAFTDPVGRIYTATPPTTSPAGGLACHFDVSTSSVFSTNTLTLGVDVAASGGGLLRYWAREASDETHVEDGLFLNDGVSATWFKVVDHATLTSTWVEISVDLATAAAANGLTLTSNFKVRWSWRDNFPVPTDGLIIDSVRIDPPPIVGQANAADASLEFPGAVNGFGSGPLVGVPGPFYVSGLPGSSVSATFKGPAGAPFALLVGPLNTANWVVPGVGSLDLGLLGPGVVSDVFIVLDGTQPGFLNSFAILGPAGTSTLTFPAPEIPPGVWTSFQGVVFTTPATIKLTAATRFSIL